jgi:lipoprotein-anchoring transpeptidase ErfK/SrfK
VKAALIVGIAAIALTATACGASSSTGSLPLGRAGSTAATDSTPAQPPVAASTEAAAVASALNEAAVPAAAPAPMAAADICATNTAAQFVLVEISEQHAWMCEHTTLVYDTPVTTGEVANGDDTPTGTWHIQSKQGARYLTTLDGSRYHVNYWLPYDDIYGFHDAAWQTFPEGSDLYKTAGSHGCVHLPETAMAWLAGWANVGATVTIRN